MIDNSNSGAVRMKVFGVGGGGNNTVDYIETIGLGKEVTTYALNTDNQALKNSKADFKIKLGEQLTQGLGAGAIPTVGAQAARESKAEIEKFLDDGQTDILFVAAGMGGGTGTGAAPEIASYAKEKGITTISIVTTPFDFEGKSRLKSAMAGVKLLEENSDVCLVISNQNLVNKHPNVFLEEAFVLPDKILQTAIASFVRVLTHKSELGKSINLNDLKKRLTDAGLAVVSFETANEKLTQEEKEETERQIEKLQNSGKRVNPERYMSTSETRKNLQIALTKSVQSEMLDLSIRGARDIIISVGLRSGVSYTTLKDVNVILKELLSYTDEEMKQVKITTSPYYLDKENNEVEITLIATGFEDSSAIDKVIENKEQESKDAIALDIY